MEDGKDFKVTFSSVSKCSNLDNFPVVTISWIYQTQVEE